MTEKPKRILVLGSTGSIGVQTLDVAKKHSDHIQIAGIAAGRRAEELLVQAEEFPDALIALGDEALAVDGSPERLLHADALMRLERSGDRFLGYGEEAVLGLIEAAKPDIVVNSLVGAQGMKASHATLSAGIDLALANKESLVVAGDILMPLALSRDSGYTTFATGGRFRPTGALRPIDSEHGAIFQCLLGEEMSEVDRLWVTASGGPFRKMEGSRLETVTAEEALAHPTWNMGPKITIDSATLMNKGLEVIEAHHLFGMPYDRIAVVVQPQSVVHSMVEMEDGSVKAHLGTTDMRIPIQFALSYPARWESPAKRMDFRALGSLEFASPDTEKFPCLSLAVEAGMAGGTMPCVMNAANEIAVAAFMDGRCSFPGIPATVAHVMERHAAEPVVSIEQLEDVDASARRDARDYLHARFG